MFEPQGQLDDLANQVLSSNSWHLKSTWTLSLTLKYCINYYWNMKNFTMTKSFLAKTVMQSHEAAVANEEMIDDEVWLSIKRQQHV